MQDSCSGVPSTRTRLGRFPDLAAIRAPGGASLTSPVVGRVA
jgi:hypothetical protein